MQTALFVDPELERQRIRWLEVYLPRPCGRPVSQNFAGGIQTLWY